MTNEQLKLKWPQAGAARYDPWTSHQAAQEVEKSGLATDQRLRVLALVRAYPGRTALELAQEDSGLDRYQIARRLPELEHIKLVHKGEARICRAGGKMSITWLPV